MTASVTDRATGFETELRDSFTSVDLLLEVDLHPRQYACARDHIGALMDEIPAGAHIALLMRFPALVITGLVGHAALTEPGSDYWDSFWKTIGRDRDEAFEAVVAQLLGDLLRECGLRDVEALRAKSIAPLMKLHAGLSATTVAALVKVVEQHVRAGRDPRGTAILENITEHGFKHRQVNLPAEFRILLKYAPAVAVGIFNRLTELLVATVAHPTTWTLDAITPTTADLPTGILRAAIDCLRSAPFLDGDTAAIALCTSRFPEVRIDAVDGEIRVLVPQSATDTTWRVWTGGAPEQIAVPADEAASLPIDAVVRETVLINLDTGIRRIVPLFDPTDPLIVFGVDGRIVSRFVSLPATELLVLVPNDTDLVSEVGTKIAITDCRPAPWGGWELRTVDLAGHAELTARRLGKDGRARRVLPIETLGFAMPEALSGIVARSGDPVYAERPLVDLPAHDGDDTKEWRVRVRRVGDLDWAIDYPWASADYVTSADPFDGLAEPLIGRYEIAAGDSYGLDLRLSVVLAEGLECSHDPVLRLPEADGLSTSVTVLASEGLTIDEPELSFEAIETERATVIRTDETALDVVVCPPHAEIRFEHPGHSATWQTSLPTIGVDEAGPGRLTVRVPGASDVSFALLDADADIVREWEADERSGVEFSLATKSVSDAAKRLLTGTLVALIEDENGDTEETEIATVVRSAPVEAPETIDHVGEGLTAQWLRLDTVQAEEVNAPTPEATPINAVVAPVDEILTAEPTASLEALGDSPVAPSRIPALLIRSGLAEQIFEAPTDYVGPHPNPFISCILATSAVVDQDAPQRDNVQSFLAARGGEDLLRILATGRLEDPRTGVFDRNVLAVNNMDRAQVEAMFEPFRIVPGPLVDVDMRTAATIEAFHRRDEWMTDPVSSEAPRYVNKTLRDVRRSSPELYDMIAARNEALHGVDTISNPWMLLSMQSLAFAAIGRLQAYGRLKTPVLTDEARAMWATLADYCPAMVAADLLIANAAVVRADALDKMRATG
ncbi:hypothetical protein [Gordonia sp. (in: high G+C Gram-positive bacteria)]|uniref:hypothetical protein n=1 Tax=Gordonia sp. (in: high G+C Gram-positive bacteria) TaxID=84139 RepID=UPI003C725130